MNSWMKRILGDKVLVKLRIQRYFFKYPNMKKLMKMNEEFRNKYEGKRCFILGNGPSLGNIDFSMLTNEYTFTVNQLSRNENFSKLHTNFHMWVDENFFDLDPNSIEDCELVNTMKAVKTEDNNPIVFYKCEAYDAINKFSLDKELDIRYFTDVWYDKKSYIIDKFINYTKPVPVFPSITCYAIALAVYMGFKEIYLLGCDCTGFINIAQAKLHQAEKSQYAYGISENEKKRLEKVYDKRTVRDELAWYVDLFDTYAIMKEYCDNNGASLYNATEGSLLECLPKVELSNILRQD